MNSVSEVEQLKSELVYSTRDMARALKVNEKTILAWNKSGTIPQGTFIGGALRWSAEEIRKWVNAGSPIREEWEISKKKTSPPDGPEAS